MKAVSLFAGVGGFDLAAQRAGVEVIATAEIDKDARSVLIKRQPDAHHYDDVKKVSHDGLLRDTGAVPSIVMGGFPCQDLSVAGKGAGLGGERSGLFWEAIRVARECRAEWIVLENVPGLLSPKRARDMGTVLGALADSGYGFAYRVLDAQHFGVAQRRRRVFIVGRLGDDGRSPAAVLDLAQGRSGSPDQGEPTGPTAPGAATEGAGGGRREVVAALTRSGLGAGGGPDDNAAQAGHLIAVYRKSRRAQSVEDHETWVEDNIGNTLNLFDYGDVRTTHLVADDVTVRRLTPVEWERLQGFPDDWTAGQSDRRRCQQMGNAVAVPCVEWLMRRLVAEASRLPQVPRDAAVLDEHDQRIADVGRQVAVANLAGDVLRGVPDLIGDADVA